MTRRMLPLTSSAVLFAFFALARPASPAAPKVNLAPRVSITSVTLLASGCGAEVNCVEVRWSVQNPPAIAPTMSFEVIGKLTTQNGSCPTTNINISDNTARSAKVGFFQGGTCTGQVKSSDMTVKLFTRDVEGQKVLSSTANKTQIF